MAENPAWILALCRLNPTTLGLGFDRGVGSARTRTAHERPAETAHARARNDGRPAATGRRTSPGCEEAAAA